MEKLEELHNSRLSLSDAQLSEEDILLNEDMRKPVLFEQLRKDRLFASAAYLVPWILSAVLLLIAIQQRLELQGKLSQPHAWRKYESEGMKRELQQTTIETMFTGGLQIVQNGSLVRKIDPLQPQYVGPPSPTMDAAWAALVEPVDFFVTEAEQAKTKTLGMSKEPSSNLFMGMTQGMHDLHCINMIRKGLELDYYPMMDSVDMKEHVWHCLDNLRQNIMCHADATVIGDYWSDYKGVGGGMVAFFENLHVCRDWRQFRKWVDQRDAVTEGRWQENARRLKGQD